MLALEKIAGTNQCSYGLKKKYLQDNLLEKKTITNGYFKQ